ncbi:INO80 complex subunit B-like isoform X2 [Xenia sp. Carnegie-2017]|uniref:INO80 complex subunit B-like isoform X2 n=1 Tax=Xenia sp. Carnegie-2017 TaxID=2897299 RepID=UPI001F036037|nr:INO80 complex subunit B-like isoform X2 [Xenia sp. Carnegie-2017]
MGRKDRLISDDELKVMESTDGSSSPKKKHKHKHKKHKRKRETTESEQSIADSPKRKKHKKREKEKEDAQEGRSLKLKIKLGGQTLTTKQVPSVSPVVTPTGEKESYEGHGLTATWVNEPWKEDLAGIQDQEKSNVEEQEEEDKWLDALEAGELDDFGCLKQEKDTSTMTARQRAMLGHEIEGENELVELPTARKKDENSEEAAKRRKQRARKRKQQMEKQIEENKVQTIERLLKKQVKSRKEVEKQKRIQKADIPRVTYINNTNGISISFPVNMDVPFKKREQKSLLSAPVKCAVKGCANIKRYSCSQTKLPLCSLECYKKIERSNIHAIGVA